MPLYEYECHDCRRRVEVIQRFSDHPLSVCDACGGRLDRLLSAPAIQFKGSGWYITDYSRKNGSSASHKGEAAESKTSTETSSGSEKGTTSEAKTGSTP